MATAGIAQQAQPAHHWAIVVHGGAGVIERATMKPETEAAYRASMTQATEAGAKVLDSGGSALDAIEAAIHILEDDPLFNAGRGAVFTAEGKNELDSAIMDGATLKAGAVAGVTRTRHPICSPAPSWTSRRTSCSSAPAPTPSPRRRDSSRSTPATSSPSAAGSRSSSN